MVTRRSLFGAIAAIAALPVVGARATEAETSDDLTALYHEHFGSPATGERQLSSNYTTFDVSDPESGRLSVLLPSDGLGNGKPTPIDAMVMDYVMIGPDVPPDFVFSLETPMSILDFIDSHYFAGGYVERVRVYWF